MRLILPAGLGDVPQMNTYAYLLQQCPSAPTFTGGDGCTAGPVSVTGGCDPNGPANGFGFTCSDLGNGNSSYQRTAEPQWNFRTPPPCDDAAAAAMGFGCRVQADGIAQYYKLGCDPDKSIDGWTKCTPLPGGGATYSRDSQSIWNQINSMFGQGNLPQETITTGTPTSASGGTVTHETTIIHEVGSGTDIGSLLSNKTVLIAGAAILALLVLKK